jgi:ribosomal protein L37E
VELKPIDKVHRKPIIFAFIGGAILGSIGGFGISVLIVLPFALLQGRSQDDFPIVFAVALFTVLPACAFGLGYFLAKREYREQLESLRLHSHFCKRCGYDLRGCADIVCPECGTGISDKQRRHIKEMTEKASN